MQQSYNPSRMIIIGGGVGPLAGVDLHRQIIELTETTGRDQDHLRVLHLSCSDMIPDRTEALLGGNPEGPALGMARILTAAEACCDRMFLQGYAAVPCNTFHAPAIWDRFQQALAEAGSRLQVLNMISITIDHIRTCYPGIRRIGIMSTTGTRKTGVYAGLLAEAGYETVQTDDQELLHEMIYNTSYGIKAVAPVSGEAMGIGRRILAELQDKGAEAVILGCTELPLALPESQYRGIPLINPVRLLALELIRSVRQ